VDTHPHLDGEHHKFIDPVHLTQEGRQQMAETFFAALKPLLVEEFSRRAQAQQAGLPATPPTL